MVRRFFSKSLFVFAAVGVMAISTAHADSANNVVRFGVGWLDPDGEATIDTVTSDADFTADAAASYFVDYERRLIPWLGLDFQVAYAEPDIVATPVGGGASTTDSEKALNGSIGVNFHLLARSRVDFYLGAFAGWTTFDDTFDDAFGYGAVVGLDVGITKSGLAILGSVRYSKVDVDFTQYPGASASFDPLLYELGLGWRF